MGSFYNNLSGGNIVMPWAAILGFLDVLALMAAAIWIAHRHQRGHQVSGGIGGTKGNWLRSAGSRPNRAARTHRQLPAAIHRPNYRDAGPSQKDHFWETSRVASAELLSCR